MQRAVSCWDVSLHRQFRHVPPPDDRLPDGRGPVTSTDKADAKLSYALFMSPALLVVGSASGLR
jgi:hypothetical protein